MKNNILENLVKKGKAFCLEKKEVITPKIYYHCQCSKNPESIEDQYEVLGILEHLKFKQLNKIEKMSKGIKFRSKE